MNFSILKEAVSKQMKRMEGTQWFASNATKDDLWDTYLGSFPEGTNPIFRERTEHDCTCCKQFIRAAGNVLAEVDGVLVSVWDVQVGGAYQVVADAMAKLVKEAGIDTIFKHYETQVGTDHNTEQSVNGPIVWSHFHHVLPKDVVMKASNIGTITGRARDYKSTLERSIKEIEPSVIEVVLELIDQNSLYKGTEYRPILTKLQELQRKYAESSNQEMFLWTESMVLGGASAIRSTVIGTLLTDLSKGIDLEDAVKMFESKVAPQNYKRSKALVTPRMIQEAQKKVAELDIEDALHRRHAITQDVTINNVLFADRTAKESMGVFDGLMAQTADKPLNLDKVEEVTVENFIKNILPKAESMEVLLDNVHTGNLMSLVAPVDQDAKSILKWNNNFSWTYNGEVTDSIAENVRKAGGNTDGVLRFSIQWNDKNDNPNDLDAHCHEPNRGLISFSNHRGNSYSGHLDVDIVNPGSKVAVENIVYTDLNRMPDGDYKFLVHNYSGRNGRNWSAEIVFGGQTLQFAYEGTMSNNQKVAVATINKKGNVLSVKSSMPHSASTKEVWGINTQKFHKVNLAMFSPNYWDDNKVGNQHLFFILDKCVNPDSARGLYNEFLSQELQEHRKVFEVLGAQLKAPYSDNQLSGLGFSFTKRASLVCKVRGSFNRTIVIKF